MAGAVGGVGSGSGNNSNWLDDKRENQLYQVLVEAGGSQPSDLGAVNPMRLTKSTGHAIRILIDCAQSGDRLVKVAELSGRLDITPQNVFKIVNMLTRAGLIVATRGRNGGVKLARAAGEIRIGDVVRATEVTHVEIEDGASAKSAASSHGVNLILDNALGAFIDVLDQHTLADMARAQKPATTTSSRKSVAQPRPFVQRSRARRPLHESNR